MVVISTINVNREEEKELIDYLENNCWKFKTFAEYNGEELYNKTLKKIRVYTQTDFDRDDIVKIYNNAERYGGSFVKSISEALLKADSENAKILQTSFSELLNKYLSM